MRTKDVKHVYYFLKFLIWVFFYVMCNDRKQLFVLISSANWGCSFTNEIEIINWYLFDLMGYYSTYTLLPCMGSHFKGNPGNETANFCVNTIFAARFSITYNSKLNPALKIVKHIYIGKWTSSSTTAQVIWCTGAHLMWCQFWVGLCTFRIINIGNSCFRYNWISTPTNKGVFIHLCFLKLFSHWQTYGWNAFCGYKYC